MSLQNPRRLIFALLPTLTALVVFGVFYYWHRQGADPTTVGQNINRKAWETSYKERGQAVPAQGPREGYWGARLGPNRADPDPDVGWRHQAVSVPGLVEIDANGYQRWLTSATKKGQVMLLGGSVGFGAYASSIATTHFAILGRELEKLDTPADVIVLASSAWKSSQELAALRNYLKDQRPDVVVMLNGLNDLTNGPTVDTLFGQQVELDNGMLSPPGYHAGDFEARTKRYIENVRRTAQLARDAKSELLVVLQPSLAEKTPRTEMEDILLRASMGEAHLAGLQSSYEQMRKHLSSLAAAGTVRFLDASRLFNDQTATTFADQWHFSDFGHALVGKAMAPEVHTLLRDRMPAAKDK